MRKKYFNTANKRQPLWKKNITNDLQRTVTINEQAKITKIIHVGKSNDLIYRADLPLDTPFFIFEFYYEVPKIWVPNANFRIPASMTDVQRDGRRHPAEYRWRKRGAKVP